jgi:hypothetical protein
MEAIKQKAPSLSARSMRLANCAAFSSSNEGLALGTDIGC